MPVDNFSLVRDLLDFKDDDDMYLLQIIQRKKDAEISSNEFLKEVKGNSRNIRSYYIRNKEYFDKIQKEVKELCDIFGARAMFHLNKKSLETSAYQTLKKLTDQIMNGAFHHAGNAYDSVVGKFSKEKKNKKWVIDIDLDEDDINEDEMIEFINGLKPEGKKFVKKVPSMNGHHIITNPFDKKSFSEKYPNIEIHKNNMTNLYIPDMYIL